MFCVKCGQQLDDNQKFCHKCGTPMGTIAQGQNQPVGYAPAPQQAMMNPAMNGGMNLPVQSAPYPQVRVNNGDNIETYNPEVIPAGQQGVYPQQYGYGPQPAPQININLEQKQETTVVQETTIVHSSSSDSDSGWLWGEIGLIGVGVWIASTWWIALITCIVLCFLLMIPVIGHVICVVLGAGVGIFAAALAKVFGAPDGAAIFIGIVFGAGAIYWNLQDRKSMVDD